MARLNSDPFQAIADTNRRQILLMLTGKKLPINMVADNFEISRPAISKHIKVLCEAGFVQITEDGRERYCELNPHGFDEIKEWIIYFEQFWKEKLQNLENLLDKRSGKSGDKIT